MQQIIEHDIAFIYYKRTTIAWLLLSVSIAPARRRILYQPCYRQKIYKLVCIPSTHQMHLRYNMIHARITLDEYANKVLNVIKAKFDLRDKSEALNKFIDLFGDEVVEKEATEEYVKKIVAMSKRHFSKYGYKKISQKEFKGLFELS